MITMWKQIFQNVASGLRTDLLRDSSDDSKHLVVLSQWYPPEHHIYAPDVAAAAQQQGYRVTVITGYPNRPGGKLHPGYKQRFSHTEIIDGVTVRRVPLVINHSHNALERVANFLSFSLSALTATSTIKDADVIYAYGTPATAAIPAQLWRKFYGIPYVLHVQDLWPESVTGSGMLGNGWLNKTAGAVLNLWLRRLYGNASKLLTLSPGMAQLLIDRGHRADQCVIVYNWAEEDTLQLKPAETFSSTGLKLLYAGNLGPMQDLETAIEAARKLEDHRDFEFKIAGEGVAEESLRAAAEGARSVKFLGNLSHEEVARRYLEADFQLVTLKDLPIFRTTIPSKLQVSLASGVPVITTVAGDVANLVLKHQAGIVAEPENPESLAKAITRAYAMTAAERAQMGINARKLYEQLMSHEAGTTRIVSIFNDLTDQHARKVLVKEMS